MQNSKPITILVADDDPDDLQYLNFIFGNSKVFEIIGSFTNGIAVVDWIKDAALPPDVLLIDMYMPKLTGVEVLKKLAEENLAKDMKAFIISTTINVHEERNFKNNQNVKFLEKPITLAQINDLPGVILHHLQLHDGNRI